MVKPDRLRIFMCAHDYTSAKLAEELGVSESTIKRYRAGKWPVSRVVELLLARNWPDWWLFLSCVSHALPNPQPQPEPVRVVEEVQP